jgi:predicted glycosyltransferase
MKYLYQIYILIFTVFITIKSNAKLGVGVSMTLPLVSKLTKLKSIGLDDDDIAVTPIFAKYANMASAILTPSSLIYPNRGENHVTYQGFHELAYLQTTRFVPDLRIFDILGIDRDTDYFIVRFNSFNAHHDVGQTGMSFEQKKELILNLEKKGLVFVSTESIIESEFEKYKLPNNPEKMHSFLAFAKLYVGESQTMTTEAAILGTPALKCNTFSGRLSVPNELESKYGLCYSFQPSEFPQLMEKLDELLNMPDLNERWQKKRKTMLEDKIDVTDFLVWFVENWPESMKIMKSTPNYPERFKNTNYPDYAPIPHPGES